MAMPDYIQNHDRMMAERLIAECLRRGYNVSVNDGEETTVSRSTDAEEILTAMGSTDADSLRVRNGETRIGTFCLIWGNDPGDTIADHTANDECESLYQHAYKPFDDDGDAADESEARLRLMEAGF